jgi:hypothetical protein
VHFYSNFGRKSRSNGGTVKQIAARTRRHASQCVGRARARRTAASASGPACAFPRPPLPEVPHSLRSLTRPEQRWSPRPRVSSAQTRRAGPTPAAAAGSPCHAMMSACPLLPPVRRGAGRCPAHPPPPINRRPFPPAHASPRTSLCSAGTIDGNHGELRAPAGCTPNQTRLHPSLPLL